MYEGIAAGGPDGGIIGTPCIGAKPGGGGGGYPCDGLNIATPPGGPGGCMPAGIPTPIGAIPTPPAMEPGCIPVCMGIGVNPGGGGGAAASAPAN